MSPSEKTDNLEFPMNQELLAEATQIREQWKVVKERIQKIEDHKNKVSAPVYERVLVDYKNRLEKVTEQVLEKKRAIDRELVTLYETQKKIAGQLEIHRHTLEEIKFRNVLGEYNDGEYQNKSKEEQEKISKFETVLSAVNTNISRYEDLFKEEIELLSIEEKRLKGQFRHKGQDIESSFEKTSLSEKDIISEKELLSEIESDDTNEDAGSLFNTDTHKTATERASSSSARIVIISGDDAGATYPLKDAISFGRAESNTVVLHDAKVSRQHAKILEKGGSYILIDLKSSNGTQVNGERIEEHVLSNNDEFQVGDTVFQFQM